MIECGVLCDSGMSENSSRCEMRGSAEREAVRICGFGEPFWGAGV
jgi:hypothetical protein